jgi:hypothetical protein
MKAERNSGKTSMTNVPKLKQMGADDCGSFVGNSFFPPQYYIENFRKYIHIFGFFYTKFSI